MSCIHFHYFQIIAQKISSRTNESILYHCLTLPSLEKSSRGDLLLVTVGNHCLFSSWSPPSRAGGLQEHLGKQRGPFSTGLRWNDEGFTSFLQGPSQEAPGRRGTKGSSPAPPPPPSSVFFIGTVQKRRPAEAAPRFCRAGPRQTPDPDCESSVACNASPQGKL